LILICSVSLGIGVFLWLRLAFFSHARIGTGAAISLIGRPLILLEHIFRRIKCPIRMGGRVRESESTVTGLNRLGLGLRNQGFGIQQ
jgi:hypothetical protein